MYRPSRLVGRVAFSALTWLPWFMVERIAERNRLSEGMNATLNSIVQWIGAELRAGVDVRVIYQGTQGVREKLSFQLTQDRATRAVAKVALRPLAKACLRREHAALSAIHEAALGPMAYPRPKKFLDDGERVALILSVPHGEWKHHRGGLDQRVQQICMKLNQHRRKAVHPVDLVRELPDCADDEGLRQLRRWTLAYLMHAFSGEGAQVSCSHGDLAPWNLLEQNDGRLFLFDWEYYSESAPALFDAFHYVLMPEFLVRNRSAFDLFVALSKPESRERAWLNEVADQCGIQRRLVPGYLAAYLWEICVRAVTCNPETGRRVANPLERVSGPAELLRYLVRPTGPGPRVLVSAYACEPNKGSEPAVGWNMVKAISSVAGETWVVTRRNNRGAISDALPDFGDSAPAFIYVDPPRWLVFWKKGGRGIRTYYYIWQLAAWAKARKLVRAKQIDLAHHVTFVNDWLFSFLSLLRVPYVWGPIGSHPRIPPGLHGTQRSYLADTARIAFQGFMRYIDPLYWLTIVRASKIVGISADVFRRGPLRLVAEHKREVCPAIGIERQWQLSQSKTDRSEAAELRAVSVGRLIAIKGFDLALEAFARFLNNGGRGNYSIVGRGPERVRLERLAVELGIEEHVTFEPWLPREQVSKRMALADVLLYPSSESGGIVVLEAMATGLPVLCLDYAGPGEAVRRCGGFSVAPRDRAGTVAELAERLGQLSRRRPGEPMRAAVRDCVLWTYGWENRSERVRNWYEEMCGAWQAANGPGNVAIERDRER